MASLADDRAAALARRQEAGRIALDLNHKDVRRIDRHACARAVEKADREYHAEMARIAAEHGVRIIR
jgi:hypothetical protein